MRREARRATKKNWTMAAVAPLALAAAAWPSEARATVPCDPNQPCHNGWIEPILIPVLGSDALIWGVLGTVGNARTLARGAKAGSGWLATGYYAAIYNFALGATWTAMAGSSLAKFPDDEYALRMQLPMGVTHLAVGSVVLGVTIAAHAKGKGPTAAAFAPVVAPFASPVAGGGVLGVSGAF